MAAAPDAPDPLIEARNVTFAAGSRRLVDDVSMAAHPGDVIAIVGPNGAGKSTLLRLLSGELAPMTGEVLLGGRPLTRLSGMAQARERAVLPQQTTITFPFTARDVVLLGRHPRRSSSRGEHATDQAVVDRALDQVEAAVLGPRLFPTLSGGEQARVSLARVLAQECTVLLLDEPTAALDIRHQHLAMRLALRVAQEGGAVVAVLHDLNLAAVATRAVLLSEGRVAAAGPPGIVLTPPTLEAVFGHPVHVLQGPDGLPVVVPTRA
jgi:iron complex transport system ATP-binding protein